MKPLVIYHDHCTDGFGAAFSAWQALGDTAEYLPLSYGYEYNPQDRALVVGGVSHCIINREVYLLDFSPLRPLVEDLINHASKVVWLDHHKSSFDMWCGGIPADGLHQEAIGGVNRCAHITLDNNRSGAMLAWEYFQPEKMIPRLIDHIDDRDRWQFKMANSKEFHEALQSHKPWSFEQWKREFLPADTGNWTIPFEGTDKYANLVKDGTAILRAHQQHVDTIIGAGARQCTIIPAVIDSLLSYQRPWNWTTDNQVFVTGLAVNCPPQFASDVGNALAKESGTFGLCWYQNKDGTIRCSIRSIGDYDVSNIAACFGGGGHKNASGFSVSLDTLQQWLSQGETDER